MNSSLFAEVSTEYTALLLVGNPQLIIIIDRDGMGALYSPKRVIMGGINQEQLK